MKINLLLLLLWALSFCISCESPNVSNIQNSPEETLVESYPLKIKWETNFYPDLSSSHGTSEFKLYKDYLIYITKRMYDKEILHIDNKHTGEQIKLIELIPSATSQFSIYDKYLILPSWHELRIIDLESLEIVKGIKGDFHGEVTVFGNKAYLHQYFGITPYLDSTRLMKIDFPTLEIEKLLTITQEEYGLFASMNPVSLDVNKFGDTLIYGTISGNPYLLFCYNKTEDDFEWIADQSGKSDKYFSKPLLDNHHVYITMQWGAEAYNKATGEQVWRRELEGHGGYRPCEPLLHEGKLYVKEINENLYCLNASDGEVLWHNDDAGGAPNNYLTHHNGYLYYCSYEALKVINMNTGKVVFKTIGPYGDISKLDPDNYLKYYSPLENMPALIDAENNVMYLTDNKRIFCFELYVP